MVLLAILFNEAIDIGAAEILSSISPRYWFLAYLSHLAAFIILLVRWKTVLGIFHNVPITGLFRSFFIGVFSSNFLPSNVGGDILRGSYLCKQGLATANVIISSVVDRFVGALATLIICLVTLYCVSGERITTVLNPNQLSAILLSMLLLPLVLYFLFKVLHIRIDFGRQRYALVYIMKVMKIFRDNSKHIFSILFLSFFSTSCVVFCYWLLAGGLNLNISIGILFLVVPLSFIAALLPISVGGLGVREGTVIYLLTIFDQPNEQTITLTLAYLLILISVTFPGGLLIMMKTRLIR